MFDRYCIQLTNTATDDNLECDFFDRKADALRHARDVGRRHNIGVNCAAKCDELGTSTLGECGDLLLELIDYR